MAGGIKRTSLSKKSEDPTPVPFHRATHGNQMSGDVHVRGLTCPVMPKGKISPPAHRPPGVKSQVIPSIGKPHPIHRKVSPHQSENLMPLRKVSLRQSENLIQFIWQTHNRSLIPLIEKECLHLVTEERERGLLITLNPQGPGPIVQIAGY